MATLLERKQKAREQLHDRLRIPAVYFPTGRPDDKTKATVHVREHYKFQTVGGLLTGTSATSVSAEREEYRDPILIFDHREIAPKVNAVVALATGAVYRVVATQPPDGFTTTADVERIVGHREQQFATQCHEGGYHG